MKAGSLSTSHPTPLLSVIIPHRDTPDALDRCIDAVVRSCAGVAHELCVVDNASRPASRPRQVADCTFRVVSNDSNRGFAVACNQGAAVAGGRYLLFLNSDVEVVPGSIAHLIAALDRDPGLAAVAPLHSRGRERVESPARRWLGPFAQALALVGATGARAPWPFLGCGVVPVPWVSAAALLVRARTFRLVGGFDERYFFYEEDEDLGWRFARRGHRVAVCRGTAVRHEGGLSANAAGAWPVLSLYAGQARFVRRRFGVGGECLYRATTFAAVAAKALWGRFRGRPAPALARVEPSRVLSLLCSRRMQVGTAEE